MKLKEEIIEYAHKLNVELIGFTKCRRFDELEEFFEYRKKNDLFNEFEEEDIEKKINPNLLMEDGKTIISIAFPYFHGVEEDDSRGFSIYTRGQDYHNVVNGYLNKICEFIIEKGGKAVSFVDSNPLPERYIAVQCGIGFIGKNNTLITDKYGSYVFLGEIITDIEIEPDKPDKRECYGCNLCVEKCPTNVIMNVGRDLNTEKCISYLTQKKALTDEEMDIISGSIFGCDICQRCCPHNKRADASNIQEFMPKEYMENTDLKAIASMDNNEFKEKYKKHSCSWRGKNLLIRNALIACMNSDRDILGKDYVKEIKSPYILEYYNRLKTR